MDKNEAIRLINYFNKIEIKEKEITTSEEKKNGQFVLIVTYKFEDQEFETKPLYYRDITEQENVRDTAKVIDNFGHNVYWLDQDIHRWPIKNPDIKDIIKEIVGETNLTFEKLHTNIRAFTVEGKDRQYGRNLESNNHWHDIVNLIKAYINAKGRDINKKYFSRMVYKWYNGERFQLHMGYGFLKALKKNIKMVQSELEQEEIKSLLVNNYQIILTGAPGTGKTYLAKEIAKAFVKMDNEANSTESYFNEHISFVQFHPSYDYTDFMEGLRPHKEDGKEMGFKLKNGIFKEFCIQANKEENKKARYVFIIDEINRGDISKIFGELFFALDPGYRGNKGKIRTQYHNINEKEDFVDFETKSFCVPDNVYIIGTMNDIDRSVESFDFAMRRRFAWIEITPEDRVSMWENEIDSYKGKALAKMNSLNKIIKMNENLGTGFQIGPAYFLKLKKYDGDFDKLWQFHLEILLKEYLRGLPKLEDQLKELKIAYDEAS